MNNKLDLWNDENPKHWVEDFDHENGNYINTCIICNQQFRGHKRRVICKLCYSNKICEEYNVEYY